MIKRFLSFCFLVLAVLASQAVAQTFPSRPVKLVVGYTPGGANDIIARLIAEHLTRMWGQPVLVENKPGANASIAATYVAGSPADGLTLLVTPPTTMIIEAALRPNPAFDPARDLAPVIGLAATPYVLVTNPALPVSSLQEFHALAKQKPKEINYGWATPGNRVAVELFSQLGGFQLFPVGYKGSANAVTAALSGEVQMLLIDAPPVAGLIKAGKLKALAVSTPTRSAILPDVPTMREGGFAFDWTAFVSMYAPKGLPPAVLEKIQHDITQVLKLPAVHTRLLGLGMEPSGISGQELSQFLGNETRRINAVLQRGDFKLD
jgi:tripartite-type tricarboxylate transporter receptor subunit TctC